jgi:uncharacterized protein DUF5362
MVVQKLDKQMVIGALKATGSNDPDVLYARKEAMLAEGEKYKLLGVVPIIVGVVMSITIIGAVVGIPAILFALSVRKTLKHNKEIAAAAYTEYLQTIGLAPRR